MLNQKIKEDLKSAQLKRDEIRVSTLRLLMSELHNLEISTGQELTDEQILGVVQKEVKKRVEAATAFKSGGREEMVKKEEDEAEILKTYLPQQLSDQELTKIVDEAITELGAVTLSDIGRVIGKVMGQVESQADGGRVSSLVKQRLGS